jgi:RNA polymerase sigma factor (sigma-70 family)
LTASNSPEWDTLFAALKRDPRSDQAWSRLYETLWPYMLDWLVSRYGVNGAQAADILQDTALQYRDRLLAGDTPDPSLRHFRAFARFNVLSVLRAESRLAALDEVDPQPASANTEDDLFHKLVVDEALERLDQRCAYALRAKYFHGKTSAEIAKAMGIEEGNVRVVLHRCREKCRELVLGLLPNS